MTNSSEMDDCEARNQFGWPERCGASLHAAPGAALNSMIDQSNNKALPWAVLAAMFGGMGFAGVLVLCVLAPWETADRATQAEMRAEFARDIAEARADIGVAKYESSLAKTIAQRLDEQAKLKR